MQLTPSVLREKGAAKGVNGLCADPEPRGILSTILFKCDFSPCTRAYTDLNWIPDAYISINSSEETTGRLRCVLKHTPCSLLFIKALAFETVADCDSKKTPPDQSGISYGHLRQRWCNPLGDASYTKTHSMQLKEHVKHKKSTSACNTPHG